MREVFPTTPELLGYPRVAGVATEVHPKKLPQSCWGKVFMSSHRGAPKKNTPELLGSHQLVLIVACTHTKMLIRGNQYVPTHTHRLGFLQGEPVCTFFKIHTHSSSWIPKWEPGCPFSRPVLPSLTRALTHLISTRAFLSLDLSLEIPHSDLSLDLSIEIFHSDLP